MMDKMIIEFLIVLCVVCMVRMALYLIKPRPTKKKGLSWAEFYDFETAKRAVKAINDVNESYQKLIEQSHRDKRNKPWNTFKDY